MLMLAREFLACKRVERLKAHAHDAKPSNTSRVHSRKQLLD